MTDLYPPTGDDALMRATRRACVFAAILICLMFCPARAQQAARPLTEKSLAELVDLQIDESAILAKVKQQGIAFAADAQALDRLKKAGASDTLLNALKSATNNTAQASPRAITYQDVLKLLELGLDESSILKRLQASPTHFTLDAEQVAELKKANASDAVIAALRGNRAPARADAPRVTDFAIVLDCSGSMSERTSDGDSKMVEAKRVVSELVARLPERLRVTLIVYGYDRDLNCQAVKVARALAPLDASGKSDLTSQVAALQPVGGTPIASALELAGRELAKNDSYCGLVLITDGKETCNGDPVAVAGTLASHLKLSFGLHVVGFNVPGDEQASLEAIARSGKGRYFNAKTAADLNNAIDGLRKDLEIQSKPADLFKKVRVPGARLVKLLPSKIELPPMEDVFIAPLGTDRMALRVQSVGRSPRYDQVMRIAASEKAETFDIWWAPVKGRAVLMAKALPITESNIEIQPADYLGLVRVTGTNLPKSQLIMLTHPGTESFATRATNIQSTDAYGKDMVVPPGVYDLWVEPSDGSRSEKVAEKLEVVAGKVTVIE